MAEWLRRLTRKPKIRTAVGSNPTLDSLVAVRNTSPGRPEPCEGNLVAVAGNCGGLMVKRPWPLLEISLSDFRGLATLNINTYLPTCLRVFFDKKLLIRNSTLILPSVLGKYNSRNYLFRQTKSLTWFYFSFICFLYHISWGT